MYDDPKQVQAVAQKIKTMAISYRPCRRATS